MVLGKALGKAAGGSVCSDVPVLQNRLHDGHGTVYPYIIIYPNTPAWAILIYLAVPACYTSFKGAGTIGRMASFFVPFIFVTITVFFIFSINDMKLRELQPVLADSTFFQLNKGAFLTASRYSEILIFFVFSYYLGEKASIVKTYFVSISVFRASFMLILLPTMLVLALSTRIT
jgi:hypothetical protein